MVSEGLLKVERDNNILFEWLKFDASAFRLQRPNLSGNGGQRMEVLELPRSYVNELQERESRTS